MKLTEEYVKNCAVGVIELKCNRLIHLTDGDGKPISIFIEEGATIEAEKTVTNELFVLLKSDSEGFRAYGYIDKEDYDAFEVLNPRSINRDRLRVLTDALSDDDIKGLVYEKSTLIDCSDNCPLKTYCEIHDDDMKSCSDIVIDWLMENE
jgi:hypothetical protein